MQTLNSKTGHTGQGLVEYILVVFLMAIVCIGVVQSLSSSTQTGFTKATQKLNTQFNN